MILPLLEQTQTVAKTYSEYMQDSQRIDQLEATLQALRSLQQRTEAFSVHYSRLAPRLQSLLPLDFASRITAVRQRLDSSHDSFASSPWQVAQLKRVSEDIDKLNQVLLTCWGTYTQQMKQPKQELHNLLAELPEIQTNESLVLQMLQSLERLASRLPESDEQLRIFDDQLERITVLLTSVQGITPAVKDFLSRVHQGTYTVADLDDEVLAWCRINDRGRSFRIKA